MTVVLDLAFPGRRPAAKITVPSDRIWAQLDALGATAASGLLTAAEQWGADDELGERDDPFEAPVETAARLYPGIDPGRRPLRRY